MKENRYFSGLINTVLRWEGINKNRLAKLSGVSPAYIGQIVNKGRLPSPETVKKIARGAQCSATELLRAAGYKTEAGLLLIRGLPGSGKTTMAEKISDFMPGEVSRFEADMFFADGDEYKFDLCKVREAHRWCIESTFNALMLDRKVIVSNTFVKNWEMSSYYFMASLFKIPFSIMEAHGEFENTHGVSQETKNRMKESWEPINTRLMEVGDDYRPDFMKMIGITECFYEGTRFLFPRITHPREGS